MRVQGLLLPLLLLLLPASRPATAVALEEPLGPVRPPVLTIEDIAQPAPIQALLAEGVTFQPTQMCPPGTTAVKVRGIRTDFASVPPRVDGVNVQRCEPMAGPSTLLFEPMEPVLDNMTSIPGCASPFPLEARADGDWVAVHVACGDGLSRIAVAEFQVGENLSFQIALEPGTDLGGDRSVLDIRQPFLGGIGFSLLYDGEKPVLACDVKDDEEELGFAICERDEADWTCQLRYRSNTGGLPGDVRGGRAAFRCGVGLRPGDIGCPVPAGLQVSFLASAMKDDPATALYQDDGDGSDWELVAQAGVAVPGLPGVFYVEIGEFHSLASGEAAFTAFLSDGSTGLFEYSLLNPPSLLFRTGDPLPEAPGQTADSLFLPAVGSGRTLFGVIGSGQMGLERSIVGELGSGADQLAAILRGGTDLVDDEAVLSASLTDESIAAGMVVLELARSVGDRSLALVILDEEMDDGGARALYGGLRTSGLQQFVMRRPFGAVTVPAMALPGIDALARRSDGIYYGAVDLAPGSALYEYAAGGPGDAMKIGVLSMVSSFSGLTYDESDALWGTDASVLYQINDQTALAVPVGSFQVEGSATLVEDMVGLAYRPSTGWLYGLSASRTLYGIDRVDAVVHEVADLTALPAAPVSLAFDGAANAYVGTEDGRITLAIQIPLGGGSGAGEPLPQPQLVVLGDTGDDAVSGLTVIPAPEPAPRLAALAATGTALLLRRAHRRGRRSAREAQRFRKTWT